MIIPCPICGARDAREFSNSGAAVLLDRPAPDAGVRDWNSYLHERANPAGETQDLWWHGQGCGAWLVVSRNTVTHAVHSAQLASEVNDAR